MRHLILAILFCTTLNLAGQELAESKFSQMTLNSITMDELFSQHSDWNLFKTKMGNPISESVVPFDMVYEIQTFEYSGAVFTFSNFLRPFDFGKVVITSQSYAFLYDGLEIKVGNHINTVSQKFPNAYATRTNGKIYMSHEFADIVLRIYYDSGNVITKIELFQDLI